jgi:hypothetical protein
VQDHECPLEVPRGSNLSASDVPKRFYVVRLVIVRDTSVRPESLPLMRLAWIFAFPEPSIIQVVLSLQLLQLAPEADRLAKILSGSPRQPLRRSDWLCSKTGQPIHPFKPIIQKTRADNQNLNLACRTIRCLSMFEKFSRPLSLLVLSCALETSGLGFPVSPNSEPSII